MTIDPSTLPEDAIVEATTLAGTTFYGRAGYVLEPDDIVVRTFSPDPLPSQEVPRDEWPNIKPGSRVRIEDVEGGSHDVVPSSVGFRAATTNSNTFLWSYVARVFVLDEPADPDADLIERMARAICETQSRWDAASEGLRRECIADARAALAVVRESEACA